MRSARAEEEVRRRETGYELSRSAVDRRYEMERREYAERGKRKTA